MRIIARDEGSVNDVLYPGWFGSGYREVSPRGGVHEQNTKVSM